MLTTSGGWRHRLGVCANGLGIITEHGPSRSMALPRCTGWLSSVLLHPYPAPIHHWHCSGRAAWRSCCDRDWLMLLLCVARRSCELIRVRVPAKLRAVRTAAWDEPWIHPGRRLPLRNSVCVAIVVKPARW